MDFMGNLLQLQITLRGIRPKIWRRFLVSEFWTFDKLYKIIQKVMGWENYHIYEFNVDGNEFGYVNNDSLDSGPDLKNSKKARIFEYAGSIGQKFLYKCDLGDSWEHEVTVENIFKEEMGQKIPICLEGERACPKEDCGGISGYEHLTKILKTGERSMNKHSKQLKSWMGDWDSERLNIKKINKKLVRHGGFG